MKKYINMVALTTAIAVLLAPLGAKAQNTIKVFRGNAGTVEVLKSTQDSTSSQISPSYLPPKKAGNTSTGKTACPPPAATSSLVYNSDTTVYDLADSVAMKKMLETPSDFSHTRKITYKTSVQNKCLNTIDITMTITPTIHLARASRKTNKRKDCSLESQVNIERKFSTITKDSYQTLTNEVAQMAINAFTNKNVSSDDEAKNYLNAKISSLLSNFDNAQQQRRTTFLAANTEVSTFDNCQKAGRIKR